MVHCIHKDQELKQAVLVDMAAVNQKEILAVLDMELQANTVLETTLVEEVEEAGTEVAVEDMDITLIQRVGAVVQDGLSLSLT